jgi:hypothetical protein
MNRQGLQAMTACGRIRPSRFSASAINAALACSPAARTVSVSTLAQTAAQAPRRIPSRRSVSPSHGGDNDRNLT